MNKKEFLLALASEKKLKPIGYPDDKYIQLIDNEIVDQDGAVLRGGDWYYGANAGVFSAILISGPALSLWGIGLRCVDVPIEWEEIK